MTGGVRNLRAMFENNKDNSTSPPDRGRSPAGSIGGASNTGTSPRPLSKVRTSFVTVERSGQMGLQLGLKKELNGEVSMLKRRSSFSIDEEDDPQGTAERKQSIAAEFQARNNNPMIEETIPEVAIETPGEEKQLGIERGREPTRKLGEKKATGGFNGTINGTVTQPLKAPTSKTTSRPTPISTTKAAIAPKASPRKAKTPIPKTPTTPKATKSLERKQPLNNGSRASLAPSHTSKPASKPTTGAAHGSVPKTRIQASPPQTGFVKPKPRSPTRPIKLPASLTAHTTSSGSKSSSSAPAPAGRNSLSRASGVSLPTHVQAHTTLSRSPSRNTTVIAPRSLTRNASALNKSRPSLGPPPSQLKKQPSRQTLPHPPAQAEDGFLTRMMRPTTSSVAKVAEKGATPPKTVQSLKRTLPREAAPKFEVLKPEAVKAKERSEHKVVRPVAKISLASPAAPPKAKENAKTVTKEPEPANAPEASTCITESSVDALEQQTNPTDVEGSKAEEVNLPEEMILEGVVEIKEESVDKDKEEGLVKIDVRMVEAERGGIEGEKIEGEATVPETCKQDEDADENEDEGIVTPETDEEEVEVPSVAEPVKEKKEEFAALALPIENSKTEVMSNTKPTIPETIPETETEPVLNDIKPDTQAEDPEDAKAREEIAKLNAEFMEVSELTDASE